MGKAGHDGLAVPGRVILAHEPSFHIGTLFIQPPLREVQSGNRRELIEPRVMQVLVALAHADGRVVTREELIECCWDGRIVGDDSINRVLSRIRRIAADIGEESFKVETLARVGYRLTRTSGSAELASTSPRPVQALSRRYVIAGGATLAAVGGGLAWWLGASPKEGIPPEAKSLFERAMIIRTDDNRQAIAYLREAVRLAPNYGQAWGALAMSYRLAIDNEDSERVAGFDQRLHEAIRNAERHDPGNGDAAAALLPTGSMFKRWEQLEPLFRTAIRDRPDHAAAYALLGTLLMEVGRWSAAVPTLRLATERAATSPVLRYKLIISLWAAGQISAGEDEIAQAMKFWPQHGAIWQTKIKLLALTGRPRQALALARDLTSRPLEETDAPDMAGRLLYLQALATRTTADVDQAIDAAVRKGRELEPERLNIALQAVSLGQVDLALDILEGVFLGVGEWALQASPKTALSTHPLFQPHASPLWREPRLDRIFEAIGLEQYWRRTGTSPDFRRIDRSGRQKIGNSSG